MKGLIKITTGFGLLAFLSSACASPAANTDITNKIIASTDTSLTQVNENAVAAEASKKAVKENIKVAKAKRHSVKQVSDVNTSVAKVDEKSPKKDLFAALFDNRAASLDKDAAINHQTEGHGIIPFASVEGFPVWIKFGGIKITRNTTTHSADDGDFLSGGARVGAGFAYPFKPNVDLTSEVAWNYFGSTSGKVSENSISANMSGFDVLVGAIYKINNFEWFLKGGALFERATYSISIPNTPVININSENYSLTLDSQGSATGILPEIKVGMNYDLNTNWAGTVAYMHAFGATPKVTLSSVTTDTTTLATVKTDLRGSTLDSVLFGVLYRFV